MRGFSTLLLVASLVAAPRVLHGQERGAAALSEDVRGLGVTTRVLMIGAHPDDEDTPLITWLARGQRVETAYLSLTRGDGGQNLIGNELGPALGMIRTEELLAARRVDGGRQYFTRAYDFGFSKSAEETYDHWSHDLLLRDVVSVVRAFRPHVIVAVFSGTPRDGHGHHQVSGLLAREAFDAAGDTSQIPARATAGLGAWTPLKFYRAQRFRPDESTLRMNVGEYDPVLGRSYAEIAGESRSQHRSQAFGVLQPKGVRWDYVRLEASRVSDADAAGEERSLFDGIARGWSRFDTLSLPPVTRARLDSLVAGRGAVHRALDLRAPAGVVEPLARYVSLLRAAHDSLLGRPRGNGEGQRICHVAVVPTCASATGDLAVSIQVDLERAERALLQAAGVAVEANATRELVAIGDTLPIVINVFNRGDTPVAIHRISAGGGNGTFLAVDDTTDVRVRPDSVATDTLPLQPLRPTLTWWMMHGRSGAMFDLGDIGIDSSISHGSRELLRGEDRASTSAAMVELTIAGAPVRARVEPIVHRYPDPVTGEVRRPIAAVPMLTVLLATELQYARAGQPIDRVVPVELASSSTKPHEVTVSLALPQGLHADTVRRVVTLPPGGRTVVNFRVRGSLGHGLLPISAVAEAEGTTYTSGYVPIEYPHIAPQRYYRTATTWLSVVDVDVPDQLRVGYIPGVGDNIPPMLRQLGIPLTVIDPAELATANLGGFTTLVIGPRAYQASDALPAANQRILDFARRGGTVVVQYGQYEMMDPGIMPHPVAISRPHDRVTLESAAVRMLDTTARVLAAPNRIANEDFAGWIQERGLYMPRTFDARYAPILEMNDPGEPSNRGAILVAPLGRGTYVYTTLSFFRQLPAGNPGAARLFVNLIAAGLR